MPQDSTIGTSKKLQSPIGKTSSVNGYSNRLTMRNPPFEGLIDKRCPCLKARASSFHRQRIVHGDNAVYALGDILRSLFFVDTIDRSGQPHPAYHGVHADR